MLSLIFFALTFSGNFLFSEGSFTFTLKHLQVLFRHGDRAPIIPYSPVKEEKELWRNGLGELTDLGKKQHYILGEMLREMYGDFITSYPREVQAHSSEIGRCLDSALWNLASFYAPTPTWQVIDHFKWEAIRVYYRPKRVDKYLYPFHSCPCAAKANLLNHIVLEDEIKEKYEGCFENIFKESGYEVKKFMDLLYFADVFNVRKIHNLTIPSWAEKYWPVFEEINYKFTFLYSNSTVLQKLRAGPFLKIVIEVMQKSQTGELQGNKVQVYSSHDIVVSTILAAAGLWNGVRPPYCATVLFELHERSDKELFVRFLYLNSTHPENGWEKIHILTLPGCGEFCPLKYFINHTRHIIPEDWEHDCKISHESENEECGETWFEDMEPL